MTIECCRYRQAPVSQEVDECFDMMVRQLLDIIRIRKPSNRSAEPSNGLAPMPKVNL